jgi:hypothetical protein
MDIEWTDGLIYPGHILAIAYVYNYNVCSWLFAYRFLLCLFLL